LAFPATATATPSGGVLVFDVNAVLAKLPPDVRAQVAWAGPQITAGLRRLWREPFSDAVLTEVALATSVPMRALTSRFLELMAANRAELLAALMVDLQRDEARLAAYVEDSDAVDTLGWVVSFLRSLYGTMVLLFDPAQISAPGHEDVDEHLDDPRVLLLLKGQIALMAALDALKEAAPRERIVELIDVAFLRLMEFRDHLQREGVRLPSPPETSDQRRTAALRYALRLRETMTDTEWKALDDARMGDLR
jgi:hypothetical protein